MAGQEDLAYFNPFAREAVEWTNSRFPGEDLDNLAGLPLTLEFEDNIYVHAEPSDPGAWSYVLDADDAAKALNATAARCCFVGHTHRALVCCRDGDRADMLTTDGVVQMEENRRYLVNVGSVGQPRDGEPRAYGVVVDDERIVLSFSASNTISPPPARKSKQPDCPHFWPSTFRSDK